MCIYLNRLNYNSIFVAVYIDYDNHTRCEYNTDVLWLKFLTRIQVSRTLHLALIYIAIQIAIQTTVIQLDHNDWTT